MSSKKHRKKLRRKREAERAKWRAWATKQMEIHAWRQRLVDATFGPLVEAMINAVFKGGEAAMSSTGHTCAGRRDEEVVKIVLDQGMPSDAPLAMVLALPCGDVRVRGPE